MVAQYLSDLEAVLSKPRLDAYKEPGGADLDTIVNYLWNIDLAEAFVPSLHAVEVALRNAIHNVMTKRSGDSMWFFEKKLLRPAELEDFVAAYEKVYKKPEPIDGLIVSQCMFGFWTALLSNPFDESIWKPNGYQALYEAFPGAVDASAKGTNISRNQISERLVLINRFRNRVFHYEKIYEWKYARHDPNNPLLRTADQDHQDIHEALKWLSPTLHSTIHAVDSFTAAWNGRTQIEAELKARLGVASFTK